MYARWYWKSNFDVFCLFIEIFAKLPNVQVSLQEHKTGNIIQSLVTYSAYKQPLTSFKLHRILQTTNCILQISFMQLNEVIERKMHQTKLQ